MVTAVTIAGVTVTVADPTIPFAVAWTSVDPTATPFTTAPSIDAIAALSVVQATVVVRSWVEPSAKWPVAVSSCVSPFATDGVAGSTSIDTRALPPPPPPPPPLLVPPVAPDPARPPAPATTLANASAARSRWAADVVEIWITLERATMVSPFSLAGQQEAREVHARTIGHYVALRESQYPGSRDWGNARIGAGMRPRAPRHTARPNLSHRTRTEGADPTLRAGDAHPRRGAPAAPGSAYLKAGPGRPSLPRHGTLAYAPRRRRPRRREGHPDEVADRKGPPRDRRPPAGLVRREARPGRRREPGRRRGRAPGGGGRGGPRGLPAGRAAPVRRPGQAARHRARGARRAPRAPRVRRPGGHPLRRRAAPRDRHAPPRRARPRPGPRPARLRDDDPRRPARLRPDRPGRERAPGAHRRGEGRVRGRAGHPRGERGAVLRRRRLPLEGTRQGRIGQRAGGVLPDGPRRHG